MERVAVAGRGNPGDYRLTAKGRDLFPAVVALMQWGDRWVYGAELAPVKVLDRATGEEIAPMRVMTPSGRALGLRDVTISPGPGADEMVRRRIGEGVTPS